MEPKMSSGSPGKLSRCLKMAQAGLEDARERSLRNEEQRRLYKVKQLELQALERKIKMKMTDLESAKRNTEIAQEHVDDLEKFRDEADRTLYETHGQVAYARHEFDNVVEQVEKAGGALVSVQRDLEE